MRSFSSAGSLEVRYFRHLTRVKVRQRNSVLYLDGLSEREPNFSSGCLISDNEKGT